MTSMRSLPTTPSTFARCGAGGVAVRFRRLPTRWLSRAGVTCDTRAPHNVEIVKDARGDPTGVFLERNFVPVLEYTLFCDLPCFKYSDACLPRKRRARGAAVAHAHPDQHAERSVRRQ